MKTLQRMRSTVLGTRTRSLAPLCHPGQSLADLFPRWMPRTRREESMKMQRQLVKQAMRAE